MSAGQRPWYEASSTLLDNLRPHPDRDAALTRYAKLAVRYESTTSHIRQVRQNVIDRLAPRPGETVFDVACGAGAMVCTLARRVGPRGHVIGIEQSPEMAALALAAAADAPNVQVLCDPVESFVSPQRADALAFCYTHDVLQNPQALANLFAQARPGARIVVAGLCLLPWWGAPVNAWVLWGARNYLTTWQGLREPWSPLKAWCPDLRIVDGYHLGTGYLAMGTVSGP